MIRHNNNLIMNFCFDVNGVPEGNILYQARLVNANNEETIIPVTVVVDRTPADVAINFPAEGARVCGVQQEIEGSLHSVLTMMALFKMRIASITL